MESTGGFPIHRTSNAGSVSTLCIIMDQADHNKESNGRANVRILSNHWPLLLSIDPPVSMFVKMHTLNWDWRAGNLEAVQWPITWSTKSDQFTNTMAPPWENHTRSWLVHKFRILILIMQSGHSFAFSMSYNGMSKIVTWLDDNFSWWTNMYFFTKFYELTNPLWNGSLSLRTGSTLAHVMACCLTAPSHYLNQCWLIISKILWLSSKSIMIRRSEDTNQLKKSWKITFIRSYQDPPISQGPMS